MMAAPLKIAEPDNRELCRIHKPSASATGLFALAVVEATDLAGVVPDGMSKGAGVALALVATAMLAKACVYRR